MEIQDSDPGKLGRQPLLYILISAVLFGISPPLAKLLVKDIPPVALAGFLYLGAFAGLSIYSFLMRTALGGNTRAAGLRRGDVPWLLGSVVSGGIIAPICLMFGLSYISGFTTSLLLNLEGVSTALIAVLFFKENAEKRLWLALLCMTLAGVFLTWDPHLGRFNLLGPLPVTLSMVCWGIDNNLTRNISIRDPLQITRIKGLVSGLASLSLAYALGMSIRWDVNIFYALLVGSFSYGISIVFFIKALAGLGSFRTGAFFSLAPFIGALTSLVFLHEWIGWVMFPAVILTVVGVWLISTERHEHLHVHWEHVHTHLHTHDDNHHTHQHTEVINGAHVHEHRHSPQRHTHTHWPDIHHRHEH